MFYRHLVLVLWFEIILISICDCAANRKTYSSMKKSGHRERQSTTDRITESRQKSIHTYLSRKTVPIEIVNNPITSQMADFPTVKPKYKNKTKTTRKMIRAAPAMIKVTTFNPRMLRRLQARPVGKLRNLNKLAPMPSFRKENKTEDKNEEIGKEETEKPQKAKFKMADFTKHGVLVQGDITGPVRELMPKRHPSVIKHPPRNDSVRRHWPTTYPCPVVEPMFSECTRPRDLDFYPLTSTRYTCTGDFTFTQYVGNVGNYLDEVVFFYTDTTVQRLRVTCTSPTSTPIMTTYLCPTTSGKLPYDPHCNFSCQYPSTTGCCTDPTSTCSEPTSTEQPFDCCTEPTSTPYNPPLYVVTCYEITEPATTPRPCKCYKVLEFTLTRDECRPTCTEPTSSCSPPTTTFLPSTCLRETICGQEIMLFYATTIKPYINPVIPCGCLTSSYEYTTCRSFRSYDGGVFNRLVKPLTTGTNTIYVYNSPQTTCPDAVLPYTYHLTTPTTVCRKHFERDVRDVFNILDGDYALDCTTSCPQWAPEFTFDSYFNLLPKSTTCPFNSLFMLLSWPDLQNKTKFVIEVNSQNIASKEKISICLAYLVCFCHLNQHYMK
ncbi:hypothetical protein CHUAL_012646 [Chamberlinius hualienensis]